MMRVIVNPAVLPPEALAELKAWLGISTSLDDAPLSALLATALDVCADFTGLVPIVCQCEEALPTPQHWQQFLPTGNWAQPMPRPMLQGNRDFGWHALSTRPVQMLNAIYQIARMAPAPRWTPAPINCGSMRMARRGSSSPIRGYIRGW